MNFKSFYLIMGIITAIFCGILNFILIKLWQNKTLKNIYLNYKDEEIIHIIKPISIITFWSPFFTGGFYGSYVIPILFLNVHNIDNVTQNNLLFFILWAVCANIVWFFMGLVVNVFTNKRIITKTPFGFTKFFGSQYTNRNVEYADVLNICMPRNNRIEFMTKNGNKFLIGTFNARTIYKDISLKIKK